ncbi:tryptophan-rich sensory protein [Sporosarcina jiandibaonis]|uniref:tryptophan-rich sensory protein n=1 Tax=Sporosarcina jiandibaonis TaxID=2715535 RepID=UPI001551752A|nr:tryptophan-rich sensory protein [Sporosarcina jiandibaonis]
MSRIIMMVLSLIGTITVYVTSIFIPFNDVTAAEIMNRLPILFTPASYVLVIWVFIYILLGGWIYNFWRTRDNYSHSVLNKRTVLFIFISLLNIVMIYSWHYEFFNLEFAVMLTILLLTATLYFTYPKRKNHFWDRVPISLLFGCSVISLIELTNYLLTFHEWSGWGLSNSLWAVIYLTISTAIALHFMYHYRDIAFNLVFIWVFIGIAVKNGFDELFVSTAALFLTFVIGAGLYLLKPSHKK